MSSPESLPGSPPVSAESHEASFRDAFYAVAAVGGTALIVEDDYGSSLALSAVLERANLNVVAADSGYGALDALETSSDIGIVLMDIMMPKMDGYSTIAAIRSRPEHADLPIIVVTGKDVTGERARCIAAGASGFVIKPIDTAVLLTAVREGLGSASAAPAVQPY